MLKKVQDYLKEVDYSFTGYVPTPEAVAFINFIKLVEGGEPENKSPVIHFKMLDNIFSKHKRHAIMCHRGVGKTTLMAEYLFLYLALFNNLPRFGKVNLALYVADSAEGGAKNLRKNIEFRYNQSDFLQAHIPEVKFTDNRLEFKNKKGESFIVKMYGAQQNIRGVKEMGIRPQLAVLDDLLSDKEASSPTILQDIENNISKAISKALHPTRSKIIYIGTPFNQNDPLYRRVESGKWNVSVYPICEKFPCEPGEFKGSWEDRFPYDSVMDLYEEAKALGQLESFYQELMLQIKSDEDRLLKDDEIIFLDPGKTKFINYYITTDFATSEKETSDYSVISVWGITADNKKILVDGICEKQLMDKNIDDLFYLVQKYNPIQVGIEVTGQQGGFIQWIQNEMVNKSIFFNLKEIRPNKNKLIRFMEILPEFKRKLILFNSKLPNNFITELRDELEGAVRKQFTSKHDDIIDTISMLYQLDYVSTGSNENIEPEQIDYLDIYEEKSNREDDLFKDIEYNIDQDTEHSVSSTYI